MSNRPIETKMNDAQIISIIAYMTLIGWLIAYLLNNPKSEKASFHIRQGLGVNLIFVASAICFMVPIIGWIAGGVGYLFGAVLWVIGLLYVLQEAEKEVPVLGAKFQEWFMAL